MPENPDGAARPDGTADRLRRILVVSGVALLELAQMMARGGGQTIHDDAAIPTFGLPPNPCALSANSAR